MGLAHLWAPDRKTPAHLWSGPVEPRPTYRAGSAIPRPTCRPGPQDPGAVVRHPTLTDGSRLRCTKAEGRHLVRRCRPFEHHLR